MPSAWDRKDKQRGMFYGSWSTLPNYSRKGASPCLPLVVPDYPKFFQWYTARHQSQRISPQHTFFTTRYQATPSKISIHVPNVVFLGISFLIYKNMLIPEKNNFLLLNVHKIIISELSNVLLNPNLGCMNP